MGQVLTSFFCGTQSRPRDTIHINKLVLKLSIPPDDVADANQIYSKTVLLSLTITHDVSKTARSDDLAHSIDYAAVCTTLVEHLQNEHYASLEALLDRAFDAVFGSHPQVAKATITAALRDTSPRCMIEATRKRGNTRKRGQTSPTGPCRCTIRGLALSAIIGVLPRERIEKQPVALDITVQRQQKTSVPEPFPFFSLSTSVRHTFSALKYFTIEALASAIASHVLEHTMDADAEVTVQLSKPNALPRTACAQVQVTRRRADFAAAAVPSPVREKTPSIKDDSASSHSVALAFGSNIGDRFANIETALRLLEIPTSLLSDLPEGAKVSVVNTSFMYETAPMYVTNQPRFINCTCMIDTNLSPMELLRLVKAIEAAVGRVPSVRNGPRAVDLDILLYNDRLVDTRPLGSRANLDNLIDELVIPHPRMCEREFVLRPLNDMIPQFVHPLRHQTIRSLLDEVASTRSPDDSPMFKVMPFPKYPADGTGLAPIHGVQVPPTAKHWVVSAPYPSTHCGSSRKTHLMAILNATPDSFSDGSRHNTVPTALECTAAAVAAGADIVDVGGYSTRPGAAHVTTEEELWRVVPVIKRIRAHPDQRVRETLVSVDTFRWQVAEEAVRVGANCINDVYAFTGPTSPSTNGDLSPPSSPSSVSSTSTLSPWEHLTKMRQVARDLGVPVVLMHSRADAGKDKGYDSYPDLVVGVQMELQWKVEAIVRGRGGVRRWLVFVDPGIGFSKPAKAQLALMRDLGRVTTEKVEVEEEEGWDGHTTKTKTNPLAGYPLLVGPSKKSILGKVLEEGDVVGKAYAGRKTTPNERGWATAAAVACAVQQGASVVRVHDVAEMRDVVAVASAIWSR